MTKEPTNDDRTRILRELQSRECFCGAKKPMMKVFCQTHYSSLPKWMRDRLYQRFGDGYEEAYANAREWLRERDDPALTRGGTDAKRG